MIGWKDDYMLGVEKIDEQHKRLFEIAGEIYDLTKNQLITDKFDPILKLISELKDYTVFHFGYEEKYMQSVGYKKFFSHKVQHDDFVDKINNIDIAKIDVDHEQYLIELLDFVVDWISVHILEVDRGYTTI